MHESCLSFVSFEDTKIYNRIRVSITDHYFIVAHVIYAYVTLTTTYTKVVTLKSMKLIVFYSASAVSCFVLLLFPHTQ